MKIPQFVTHGIGCTFSLAYALMLAMAFLGSLFCAVFGAVGVAKCFQTGQFGFYSLILTVFGCGGVLLLSCIIWQNAIPKRPKDAELQVPAQSESALTYTTLEQRLEEMHAIGGDEEVTLDKDARFLSWDDRAMREIVIQGLGGEDWLAFFWPLRGMENVCLSRRQLTELFLREKVQLSERCSRFQPGAVAFCRGGHLLVYPASAMEDFLEEYPPVQQEADFRRWMEECTRMGGAGLLASRLN